MKKNRKHILALAITILPFYLVAILQKIFFSQEQTFVEEYLGYYMLLGIVGISVILLTNKYLLKYKIDIFRTVNSKFLNELALTGIVFASYYVIQSIGSLSYGIWWAANTESTAFNELLSKIFDNTLYSIVFIGPFIWFNQGFLTLSIAFILINLWALSASKYWVWISIFLTAFLTALLQIDNGIPAMINSFLFIVVFSVIFFRHRSVLPLLIATILIQTIDLVNFWYYM